MSTLPSTSDEILENAVQRFWEVFPAVWERIRGNLHFILMHQNEVTVEQFHILRYIRRGYKSISQLAEKKSISRSAISQSVDILVDKGYVTRTQIEKDRRCITLDLTSAGNELVNKIYQQNRDWMANQLGSYEPEDIPELIHALDILERAFLEED
jgi:DNA-binding MarR family transcriptional regulator